MSGRNVNAVVRGSAVAAAMAVAPVAMAQEAIMLETIGAVRMAQPHEVKRMAAEETQSRPQAQNQQQHEEQDASAR